MNHIPTAFTLRATRIFAPWDNRATLDIRRPKLEVQIAIPGSGVGAAGAWIDARLNTGEDISVFPMEYAEQIGIMGSRFLPRQDMQPPHLEFAPVQMQIGNQVHHTTSGTIPRVWDTIVGFCSDEAYFETRNSNNGFVGILDALDECARFEIMFGKSSLVGFHIPTLNVTI